ncbi:MAG: zf-HC2 domain-containing protein [Nitrosomonas sp.]|nr:zf-HC2 domain-containing protein [Nitrosomonas sp.]
MLNCKQASLLASRAMDEKLSVRERVALKLHLWLCRSCTHFTGQLTFLREAAQHSRMRPDFNLTDEARQRIARVLKNQQSEINDFEKRQ